MKSSSSSFLSKKAIKISIFIALGLVIIAAPSYYFYNKYQKAQIYLKDPTLATKEKAQKVITQVGKLMELPLDEEPTVATVTDRDKLKDQPFFDKAKKGDKLLIYNEAKIAILYNPKTNKIVNVSPINIENTDSATSTLPIIPPSPQTQESPINVVLYNGTNITGLTHTVEKDLNKKIKNIDIVSRANSKEGYIKSLVIDLSGNNDDIAQNIASALKAEIGKLPDKEIKPVSKTPGEKIDILVIIGKEYSEK